VIQSFGASIFSGECKGDFAQAAGQADGLVVAARTPQDEADAGILRGAVHFLGENTHCRRRTEACAFWETSNVEFVFCQRRVSLVAQSR
jgi:hypothetical protein